jgi:hypothetical protein
MASRNAEPREPATRGTKNVFADLGFPDAADRQAKLRLAYALHQVLDARKLSQADAAKVLGGTQTKVPLRFVTARRGSAPSKHCGKSDGRASCCPAPRRPASRALRARCIMCGRGEVMRHPAVAVIAPDRLPQPGLGHAACCLTVRSGAEHSCEQQTSATSWRCSSRNFLTAPLATTRSC